MQSFPKSSAIGIDFDKIGVLAVPTKALSY